MQFDKDKFFDGFRTFYKTATGKRTMSVSVANAVEFLLDNFVAYGNEWKDLRHIAYALATIAHETAWTFKPIKEYRGRALSTQQKKYWNTGFYGRGYVQLTWEANYRKASGKLRKDLVSNPDLALDPKIAFQILTFGMLEGWFTGKKLSDYISGGVVKYRDARRIINGVDKATQIAAYAYSLQDVLTLSLIKGNAPKIVKKTTSSQPVVAPDPVESVGHVEQEDDWKGQEEVRPDNWEELQNNPEPKEDKETGDPPKAGEPVPDNPAKEGEPVVGGRPNDTPIPVPKEEPKATSGWGAWVGNIRTQWASLGIGTISLGSLGFLTNPLFVKIALGFLAVAIIVSVTVWITSMVIKAIEKRAREREAHELTMKQLEIRSDPTKYNVRAV